jgi:hypothetical protein
MRIAIAIAERRKLVILIEADQYLKCIDALNYPEDQQKSGLAEESIRLIFCISSGEPVKGRLG